MCTWYPPPPPGSATYAPMYTNLLFCLYISVYIAFDVGVQCVTVSMILVRLKTDPNTMYLYYVHGRCNTK